MENPFDDMPEPPQIDGDSAPVKYDNWPSAEGYEEVPEDFKPTNRRPVPALRCTHERADGTRCKNFGVRGTGVDAPGEPGSAMPAMCFIHGGSLPSVKQKAEAIVLSARMKLYANADLAADTLVDLMQNSTADAIKLKAVELLLNRVGVKEAIDINVQVTETRSYSEDILSKLNTMRARVEPSPEDLGEQDIEDAEEVDESQDPV